VAIKSSNTISHHLNTLHYLVLGCLLSSASVVRMVVWIQARRFINQEWHILSVSHETIHFLATFAFASANGVYSASPELIVSLID
jgi:hypothetical protein